jgi:lactoylglutathione lyase
MTRSTISAGFVCALLAAAMPANAQELRYDHVHMGAPEPAKSVAWWLEHLGPVPGAAPDRVLFGPTIVAFNVSPAALPSQGGVIDHIAISVPNVAAKAAEIVAAGGKLHTAAQEWPGMFTRAFVEDPWGVKIELVNDTSLRGLHHVHLRVPDADASFKWYLDKFGGSREKLNNRVDGLRYGSVWLLADTLASGETAAPSAGRAIDHLGWRPINLDTAAAELKRKGVKFTVEPRDGAGGLRISFVEDPAGVKIEVVQRPTP